MSFENPSPENPVTPTPPTGSRKKLVLSFVIFGIIVSIISGFIVDYNINSYQRFSKLSEHGDIPNQVITTFDDSKNINFPQDRSNFVNSDCTVSGSNWVAQENKKQGVAMNTSDWQHIALEYALGSALWLNKTSANCGDEVDIHASLFHDKGAPDEKSPISIHALRIGWYNGSGARDVWTTGPLHLKTYPVKKPKDNLRIIETNWPVTAKMQIGSDWTPGFYLIVTENQGGNIENAAPLVIHAPVGTSKVLLMHSFATWNAYNSFGGYSAYLGPGDSVVSRRDNRSRVVSLDRPIDGSGGYSIHRDAISMVQFLEKNGFNFDNVSDEDIDNYPSILKNYNELILSGHAEYMTRRIFNSMIAARNARINLAIFGGNTAIWQTRYNSTHIGPDRRLVIYRQATEDPDEDQNLVTVHFDDKRINTPPILFTGSMATGTHVFGDYKASSIPSWTGLQSNASIDGISPDTEIEASDQRSAASPPNVQVMFEGNMAYADPSTRPVGLTIHPKAEVVWFTNSNGQATFNAGFTTWACNLIETCAYSTVDTTSRNVIDKLTARVITLWETRGIGNKLNPQPASSTPK